MMKNIITAIIAICFAATASAQVNQTEIQKRIDALKSRSMKVDTSFSKLGLQNQLTTASYFGLPQPLTANTKLFINATGNIVYSNMPVLHLTTPGDAMPIAQLNAKGFNMPVKHVTVIRPADMLSQALIIK